MITYLRLAIALAVLVPLAAAGEPAGGRPARVAVISDTHVGTAKGEEVLRAFVEKANAEAYDLVLHSGDLTEIGSEAELEAFAAAARLLRMPLAAAPGNHDLRWSSGGWRGFEGRLGPRTKRVDLAGVAFFALDSSVFGEPHGALDRGQLDWLRRELSAIPGPAVLFFHHMPFESLPRSVGGEDELEDLLGGEKIRLILCGHGHTFRSWRRDGVPVVETGALFSSREYRELRIDGQRLEVFRSSLAGAAPVLDLRVELAGPLPPRPEVSGSRETAPGEREIRVRGSPGPLFKAFLDGTEVRGARAGGAGEGISITFGTGGLPPGRHEALLLFGADPSSLSAARTRFTTGPEALARAIELPSGSLGGATVLGGSAFFGALDGSLRAVALEGGEIAWSRPLGGRILVRPEAAGDRVIAGTEEGELACLDPAGRPLWRRSLGSAVTGAPRFDPPSGLCLVPTGDGTLRAVDHLDGAERWMFKAGGAIHVRPAVEAGVVLFGSWDRSFYALDISSGSKRWSREVDPSFYFAPSTGWPAAGGGGVLFPFARKQADSESLLSLEVATGRKLWGRPALTAYSSPLLLEDRAVLAEPDGTAFAVSRASGEPLWSVKAGGSFWRSSPFLWRGRIHILSSEGTLFELDGKGGAKAVLALPGGPFSATPAAVGDRAVLPTYGGKLWVLSLPQG